MTTNFQLAKKIADHVQLLSVVLKSANVEAKFDPAEIPEQISLSQVYRAGLIEADILSNFDKFSVVVEFKFFATEEVGDAVTEEAEEGNVATLDAAFVLVYSLPSGLEVEKRCFKHFAEVNGPYNAWPYWRELVQSVTGRVGLAGVTIPVFHPRPVDVVDHEASESVEP